MNNSDRLRYSLRFLEFLGKARTRYSVHSPFLYDLIMETLRGQKSIPGDSKIETIRKKMRKDARIINKTDYGTGGQGQKSAYPLKLSYIARTSMSSKAKARKLALLAKFMKARNILEIGTSLGLTAAYFGLAGPGVRVLSLEGCSETAAIARENLAALDMHNVSVMEGPFEHSLTGALRLMPAPDLVFFDGNHRREASLDYFYKCLAHASNDSVFVFDDIHWSDEMESAWDEIRQHESVRLSIDLFHMGWIFFRKELSRQDFILRYL